MSTHDCQRSTYSSSLKFVGEKAVGSTAYRHHGPLYFCDLIYKNVFDTKFSLSLIEDKNRALSVNNISNLVIEIG